MFLQIALPVKLVQLLYIEGVISKEILNQLQSTGGYLTDNPLRALLSAVYMDHNKLRVFGTILLRSKKTVPLANIILNEYGKIYSMLYSHYYYMQTYYVTQYSIIIIYWNHSLLKIHQFVVKYIMLIF